ncbi:FadR/GntR family transcriptional regulator [Alteromonas sp. KUL49]|uniref:FadR/GntR family transcriptional regulator n=1 Tax=Alteromonas sp. KUL49 TaxID=2480798 RepID=UPI00102F0F5B|nr:FadR/GntR family transcriptional regulator [Alteromonas sp. KUL49]TAP39435.1 FadR family transcriptional regulator [Alteromonas sp. KUL49]GEA12236.1 GntR family transcriptional regulator [Alteromonas sp. KUL49]
MSKLDRNKNLSQRMTSELGRAIIAGKYDKDKGLPTEAILCEQFGISRTAVREAIKMLTAKGLISSKPKQGIRILSQEDWNILDSEMLSWMLDEEPSLAVLKEFTQMRMAVEPEACALASRLQNKERIAAIGDALERMKNAMESGDQEAELRADIDFHVAILYATSNRFYIRMRDFTKTALYVSIQHTSPIKALPEAIYEEHARIYQAIKTGNAERAKNGMFLLIDEALTFIEQKLDTN